MTGIKRQLKSQKYSRKSLELSLKLFDCELHVWVQVQVESVCTPVFTQYEGNKDWLTNLRCRCGAEAVVGQGNEERGEVGEVSSKNHMTHNNSGVLWRQKCLWFKVICFVCVTQKQNTAILNWLLVLFRDIKNICDIHIYIF